MHGDLREREAIEQACPCVSNDDKAHGPVEGEAMSEICAHTGLCETDRNR